MEGRGGAGCECVCGGACMCGVWAETEAERHSQAKDNAVCVLGGGGRGVEGRGGTGCVCVCGGACMWAETEAERHSQAKDNAVCVCVCVRACARARAHICVWCGPAVCVFVGARRCVAFSVACAAV